MNVFNFPDVGEGIHEGRVVEWLVAEGDVVTEDQPSAQGGDRQGGGRAALTIRRHRFATPCSGRCHHLCR